MLFSGMTVGGCVPPRKRIRKLVARASADRTNTMSSNVLGQAGALTGLTVAVPRCFHLARRFNFSGNAGLPRPSL